jgi:YhcH/YjgK/YiaL family protein
MIFGNINQPQTYSYLSPTLKQAIIYLKQTDVYNLPVGRHELEKDLLYVNVMEFDTIFADQKQAEVHQEYIDIQFLIRGEERICFGLENTTNPVAKEYDATNDYYLVSSVSCESELLLSPGMFAIFFPEQPHKPGCCIEKPMLLKKAVMKIHKSLLV